ncbi:hypothetical protein M8818_005094 [Zalaria obscura]|uniref:Uncharacterized protein n=1 Tax=Zalaria obscura TaxID=2024903 RepID=A0ACC3S9Q5_9PEZI
MQNVSGLTLLRQARRAAAMQAALGASSRSTDDMPTYEAPTAEPLNLKLTPPTSKVYPASADGPCAKSHSRDDGVDLVESSHPSCYMGHKPKTDNPHNRA